MRRNTKQIKYIELYNFMKIEKLTQRDMADMLGVGVSTLNAILNCHKPVNDEVIERFCTLTGKTEEEVVAKPGDWNYREPKLYKSEIDRLVKHEDNGENSANSEDVKEYDKDINDEVLEPVNTEIRANIVDFTEDEARSFALKKKMFGESDITKQAEAQWPQIFEEVCGNGKKKEESVFMVTDKDKAKIKEMQAETKVIELREWVCELIMNGRKEIELSELVQKIIA